MATVFEAVADPTRRHILDLLRERPRIVGELVDALEISQPGVSKHLRVLREVGLVQVRQDAQRRVYELRPEPLALLDAWLKFLPRPVGSEAGSPRRLPTRASRGGQE